eukprot:6819696-Heterocapsa_arctica.AAC.1
MQPSPTISAQPSIDMESTALFMPAEIGSPRLYLLPTIVCIIAKVPPSPWWLTRITVPTYFTQTTHVSAQKIMLKTSWTSSGEGSDVL